MEKELSLGKALLILALSLVLIVSAGLFVGYKFFWNQYEQVTVDDIQLKAAMDVVKKDPKDPRGHLALGYQYLRRGEKDKALREYQEAQKLAKPDDLSVLFNLGLAYKEIGKKDEAISYLEKVVKKNKWHFLAQYNLALLYADKKEYEKSLKAFEIALRLESGAADVLVSRARVYKDMGEIAKARADVEKALKFVPDYQEALQLKQELAKQQ